MKKGLFILAGIIMSALAFPQQFDPPGIDTIPFKKVKVKVGADFAMQFQALNQNGDSLVPLGSGFNLPTANLNVKALLAKGIEVHLTTYLSSRHHNDTWVKGGYLLVNDLPFKGADKFMKYLTLKVGDMQLNYGDAHAFYSDNGNIINNPFVGNLVMQSMTTATAAEIYGHYSDFHVMGAITTGTLNPSIASYNSDDSVYSVNNQLSQLAFYWKAAFDKSFTDDFRLRIALSGYNSPKNNAGSLYFGDRTGSRFYLVMLPQTNNSNDVSISSNAWTGRWGPGFTYKDNSYMLNLFTKYKGLELFGTLESAKGLTASHQDFNYTQYELNTQYYFGDKENFYVGGKINGVDNHAGQKIFRVEGALGWYLTSNIIIKAEYINQKYTGFADYGTDAGFNGFMFESGISF